ncbi:tripartite tricarboxylate transporter TctB family protein [Robertmurraya korlensis]|uniref:tripartite tricarboxylate transporter TctB family protein n=1 Tax=Robertmurraya korlensis TaxID=519977 RepID=UPI000824A16C|nr:tripartite tricarboxylate transporter TctB family protein [Robertmurraya korlensis]
MKDLLTMEITYSEYHLIFPKIIQTILIILLLAILVQQVSKRIRSGNKNIFFKKMMVENFDKLKFFGTILLLFGYVFFLEVIGFIAASIIFMFVLTILLRGNLKRNTLIISLVNSVTTSVLVWFFFGYLFDITLP